MAKSAALVKAEDRNKELEAKVKELEKENVRLETQNKELDGLNEEYAEQLNAIESSGTVAGAGPQLLKDTKGNTYRLTQPKVKYKGKVNTFKDLAANKKLVDELVKIKAGSLEKVV